MHKQMMLNNDSQKSSPTHTAKQNRSTFHWYWSNSSLHGPLPFQFSVLRALAFYPLST